MVSFAFFNVQKAHQLGIQYDWFLRLDIQIVNALFLEVLRIVVFHSEYNQNINKELKILGTAEN